MTGCQASEQGRPPLNFGSLVKAHEGVNILRERLGAPSLFGERVLKCAFVGFSRSVFSQYPRRLSPRPFPP